MVVNIKYITLYNKIVFMCKQNWQVTAADRKKKVEKG